MINMKTNMETNMTLAKEYGQQFLESDEKYKSSKPVLEKIINKEEQYKWSCVNWTIDQDKDFLISLKSTSPEAIAKSFSFLRNLISYICKQKKIDTPEFKLDCDLYSFIDYDKVLSTIVSYEELKDILKQLKENTRIKLIIELAWLTLTNNDIKNLKEEDIEFKTDELLGIETAILKLSKDRCMVVEDQEIIADIKKCLKQTEYNIEARNGSYKRMILKNSKYLIKPVIVGQGSKEDQEDTPITNPSQTMKKALQQQGIICKGINVGELTIKDIRKSKTVYMLHNKEFFNKSDITDLLGGGNKESSLYWLEKIAAIKYDMN